MPALPGQAGRTALRCRAHETFANPAKREALRFLCQCRLQLLDWLVHRFVAKAKCLMVHRHDVPSAGPVGHFECLLGCAMIPYPGPIGPNWHDGRLERSARLQGPESLDAG